MHVLYVAGAGQNGLDAWIVAAEALAGLVMLLNLSNQLTYPRPIFTANARYRVLQKLNEW
jgi:NAD(P)H-hydrate repair Nnr-like enzyme with NAD(P)H-hydrate epimerase domain